MRRRRIDRAIRPWRGTFPRNLAFGILFGAWFSGAGLFGAALFGAARAAPAASPVVGCPSLVNLRMLLRQTKDDMAAAAALLGNDGADHLGCVVLARDAATGLQEHLTLNGSEYECLTLRGTSVCHWVVAGSVTPGRPTGAKARPGEKPAQPSEKGRR